MLKYNQLEKVRCQKLTKITYGHLEIFLKLQPVLWRVSQWNYLFAT